jgi:NTE family protein
MTWSACHTDVAPLAPGPYPHSMATNTTDGSDGSVAFVLGGGGLRGAAEVGMIKALAETDIRPDMVFGTSIGSLNGAIIASDTFEDAAKHLELRWINELASTSILRESAWGRINNVVRHRTHLHSNQGLRNLLTEWLPHRSFEELPVQFQCSAACIETSSEAWFESGSLIDAVLASCAAPGLMPPVEANGLHYIDGGVVNSIPVSRAVELGASTIYVLHVGNIDAPLRVPRHAWDVAFVAFEIARRHRFHRDMETLPANITAHVLPTGVDPTRKFNDPTKLRYNHRGSIAASIERAYRGTARYLRDIS